MKRKYGSHHGGSKKPRTVSVAKFYHAAKAGYQVGKQVHKGYTAAKRLVNTAIKTYNRTRKSSSARSKSKLVTTQLQGISQHNDWSTKPRLTLYVGRGISMKTVGKFMLVHTADQVMSAVQGRQATQESTAMMNYNHMSANTTTTVTQYTSKWNTDMFQLNPYSTAPQNAIYTTGPVPSSVNADKIFLKSIDHEIKVLSMTTISQRVSIYYLLCKQNTDKDIITLWDHCLVNGAGYLQTINTAATSIADLANAKSGGYGLRTDVGESPFKVPGFSKYWKVLHHDRFILQPGDQVSLKKRIVYNKFLMKQTINDLDAGTLYVGKWSVVPFLVVDGALVGISTALGTDSTHVAPGAVRVGVVTRDCYNFAALPVNRYTIQRSEIGYIKQDGTDTIKIINDVDTATIQTFQ